MSVLPIIPRHLALLLLLAALAPPQLAADEPSRLQSGADDAEAHVANAKELSKLHNFAGALEQLEAAIRLNPDHLDAHFRDLSDHGGHLGRPDVDSDDDFGVSRHPT